MEGVKEALDAEVYRSVHVFRVKQKLARKRSMNRCLQFLPNHHKFSNL
ncbi:hypothetical protein OIU76_000741 [Salix suchowensis]|uniref:Uncharacterized protein n=3 Tax=Salix TaxID=40685 RepID=A0A9Q0ZWD6_SALPP|nr:hypothetical protein OIU76_000741 [Salix suchowensis]KAJ6375777.1 hypothetical protein OIU77_000693 [Salix suchowensis]KAJ6749249.1 hypothetical protein OIU79_030194 [Salix purpurea]